MAIEINQNVKIYFEVKIDGEVVDGTTSNKPFEFTFGVGQVIPGLEARIKDMQVGEEANFVVPAAEAYGEFSEEAKQVLPIEEVAGIPDLRVGMQLQGEDEDGQPIQVIVEKITETEVTLDYNHPLAGKDIEYTVKIDSLLT